MIPRILHRVVPAQPSAEAERFWVGWQALHPGWEFKSWVDPQDPKAFELGQEFAFATSGAQLADLVRLEVLWRYGGVYVDSDVEPVRALDTLLKESLFICTEDGDMLSNAVMGCVPGHPAVRACIDAILAERRTRLDVPPNIATGPALATQFMGGREDITVLPPECFYPYHYSEPRPRDIATVITPFTYGVHHWAASWVAKPTGDSVPWRSKFRRLVRRSLSPVTRRVLAGFRLELERQPRNAFGTYVGNNRVIVSLPDHTPLVCLADDRSITPELIATGIYDLPYWRFLGKHLRPGDRVVEVGANIGLFTVRMARLVGRFGSITAFEPDPDLFEALNENLSCNWLTDRTTTHQIAVAQQAGTAIFHRNSVLRGNGGLNAVGDSSISVTTCRLDETIRQDLPLHLVKIDVEGAECDVLEGMKGLLRAGAIRMIDVEVVRANAGDAWPRLVASLKHLVDEYGASAHLIALDGTLNPVTIDAVLGGTGHLAHVIFTLPHRQA